MRVSKQETGRAVLAARFMIETSKLLETISAWDVRRLLKEAPPSARSARVERTSLYACTSVSVTSGICVMLHSIFVVLIIAIAASITSLAQKYEGRPGDYGYRHLEYHHNGIIDELRRKTGRSCCDGIGECRATYVNIPERKAFLDGNWCPIGAAPIRRDIVLPDQFALVCADRSAGPVYPCPAVYCVAVGPGT
jgi:hypothetical protein